MCTEIIEERDLLAYMTRELIKSCTESLNSTKLKNSSCSNFNSDIYGSSGTKIYLLNILMK